jgi:hypothetical protein
MGGRASFVHPSVYNKEFPGGEEIRKKIHKVAESVYTESGYELAIQQSEFETIMKSLNNLYELYKAEAAVPANPPQKPPPIQRQKTPYMQPMPPREGLVFEKPHAQWQSPSVNQKPPANPTRITKYIAQKEKVFIREDSEVDPRYVRVSSKEYYLYNITQNGTIQHQFYNGNFPRGAEKADDAKYFLYEKK